MGSSKRISPPVEIESSKGIKRRNVEDSEDDEDEARILAEEAETRKIQAESARNQKALLLKIEKEGSDMENPNSGTFDEVLREANLVFKGINTIKGGCVDARIMRLASEKLSKQAANIGQASQRVSISALSKSLFTHFGDNDTSTLNLEKLGEEVGVFFRSIPKWDCMLGPIDIEIAVKKAQVKRERKKAIVASTDVETLKVITEADEEDGEGGESGAGEKGASGPDLFALHKELQSELTKKLKNKRASGVKPNIFETTFDSTSFTQTVENMFALAFLVKDGIVYVSVDSNGLPHVEVKETLSKHNGESTQQTAGNEVQCVASLNQEDWEKLVQAYELNHENALLAHRDGKFYDDVE